MNTERTERKVLHQGKNLALDLKRHIIEDMARYRIILKLFSEKFVEIMHSHI